MAKQTGLYHIRGKVGDYKYYGMKGVDGTIMAKQNEGMSDRVKTDAAYENTRRNNYEFGMSTSTAGAVTRAFSQKWRYLLVPFATAMIAKDLLKLAKESSSETWGDRRLSAFDLGVALPQVMQKFVKNSIDDFSPIEGSIKTIEDVLTISVNATNLINEKAAAAGCDGVRVVLVNSNILASAGGFSEKNTTPASCTNHILATDDVTFGDDLALSEAAISGSDDALVASVVLLPYRTIGDEKYIMQEFCSAYFVPGN